MSIRTVRLHAANIGGDFDCLGGSFFGTVDEKGERDNSLSLYGTKVEGGLFLIAGFSSTGEVYLDSAHVFGVLACDGGRFDGCGKKALSCDSIEIKGSLLLSNKFHEAETSFEALGEVNLTRAVIHGDLDCRYGKLENPIGKAVTCVGTDIRGSFFFSNVEKLEGTVDLTSAHAGVLVDDQETWQKINEKYVLDNFRYERLGLGVPVDGKVRVNWLVNQRSDMIWDKFSPQPWKQLARVLREMGYLEAARRIAIAEQDQFRHAGKATSPNLHGFYGIMTGYGYRPLLMPMLMIVVWLFSWMAFDDAAKGGYMGPVSPLIHANKEMDECGAPGEIDIKLNQKVFWIQCSKLPPEYTTFEPFMYSLDLILPFVDMQQERDWAPIVALSDGTPLPKGIIFRVLMWFEILFGWVASLLLVAGLGNLIKRE